MKPSGIRRDSTPAWVHVPRAHDDGGRTASDGRWTLKIVPPESPHPPAGFLSLRAIFHDCEIMLL